jgi:DNA-directed RNA polymerase subunit RPC12/RpoP
MDKQMIEEMAKLVQGDMCGDVPCEECNYHGKMKILPKYCGTYLIAKKLYNAGYRKIPENAVVLTDKNDIQQYEWSKLVDKMGVIEFGEKVRKNTAEKFAERLKEMAYQSTDWSHGVHPMVVEVDYIDEIAEEITEGEQGKLDEQKNCIYEQRKELDFVWWECSACGSGFNFYANTPYENRFHYCPYCGAKIAECKELQNERND